MKDKQILSIIEKLQAAIKEEGVENSEFFVHIKDGIGISLFGNIPQEDIVKSCEMAAMQLADENNPSFIAVIQERDQEILELLEEKIEMLSLLLKAVKEDETIIALSQCRAEALGCLEAHKKYMFHPVHEQVRE